MKVREFLRDCWKGVTVCIENHISNDVIAINEAAYITSEPVLESNIVSLYTEYYPGLGVTGITLRVIES